MMEPFFAHSRTDTTQGWEPLEEHLETVASRAETFAAAFESCSWGRLAGLWHDLGKYRADFQRKIRGERLQATHAGVGAALAYPAAPPLAFAIAGHHTGMANLTTQADSTQSPLDSVVRENATILAAIHDVVPMSILKQSRPLVPSWLKVTDGDERKLRMEMWTRFLFSALIDADRLATEAFDDALSSMRTEIAETLPIDQNGYAVLSAWRGS